MPLGPGAADKEENLESAWPIPSLVRRGVELCCLSLGGGANAVLGGKKWPIRVSYICCGVSAAGSEEKRGGARPEANLFAVYRF